MHGVVPSVSGDFDRFRLKSSVSSREKQHECCGTHIDVLKKKTHTIPLPITAQRNPCDISSSISQAVSLDILASSLGALSRQKWIWES